jgi:limonene-1,2-epoxide hydrolase
MQIYSDNMDINTAQSQTKQEASMSDAIRQLFATGEAMNSDKFITLFSENARYRFGSFEPVVGREAIRNSVTNFFPLVKALYHDIQSIWEQGNKLIVEMDVIYTRHNDTVITLPVADIFRFEGDLIRDMRIFMDVNLVFA